MFALHVSRSTEERETSVCKQAESTLLFGSKALPALDTAGLHAWKWSTVGVLNEIHKRYSLNNESALVQLGFYMTTPFLVLDDSDQ